MITASPSTQMSVMFCAAARQHRAPQCRPIGAHHWTIPSVCFPPSIRRPIPLPPAVADRFTHSNERHTLPNSGAAWRMPPKDNDDRSVGVAHSCCRAVNRAGTSYLTVWPARRGRDYAAVQADRGADRDAMRADRDRLDASVRCARSLGRR